MHGQNHFSYLHLLCLLKEYSTRLRLYLNLPSDLTATDQKTFSQRNTELLKDE